MKTAQSIFTYVSGVHPNALAVNSSGAATQDGTEYIADGINNFWLGPTQDIMDYAGLTPDGVTEAAVTGQIKEAYQKAFSIGPGIIGEWGLSSTPTTTGHRALLLQGQGVLRASYQALDNAVYVGDGNNATAPYFYHADDAAGATRNTTGVYLILPSFTETVSEEATVNDTKTSGTDGGGFTSGAWQTRDLNTSDSNISGLSVGSNQITIPPGKYFIEGEAPAIGVNRHKAKLYNITDASDSILGSTEYAGDVDQVMTKSKILGFIDIGVTKVYEIRHYCQTTQAANGFGISGGASTGSVSEIYTQVKISKITEIPLFITY